MDILVVIAINVIMMSALFVVGIYQFLQIEDKKKRRPMDRLRTSVMVAELDVDEVTIRRLVRDERYADAVQHLIDYAEVDRFTAQATVETLKQQEYRPYRTRKK